MILIFLCVFGTLIDGCAVFLDSYSFYSLDFDLRVFSESFSMVCFGFNISYLYVFLVFRVLKVLIILNGYYWDWRFLVFVSGAVKVNNEPAQGRNRRALGDIGNYGVQALDGKPNAQISRPMTRFTILSLSLSSYLLSEKFKLLENSGFNHLTTILTLSANCWLNFVLQELSCTTVSKRTRGSRDKQGSEL